MNDSEHISNIETNKYNTVFFYDNLKLQRNAPSIHTANDK